MLQRRKTATDSAASSPRERCGFTGQPYMSGPEYFSSKVQDSGPNVVTVPRQRTPELVWIGVVEDHSIFLQIVGNALVELDQVGAGLHHRPVHVVGEHGLKVRRERAPGLAVHQIE